MPPADEGEEIDASTALWILQVLGNTNMYKIKINSPEWLHPTFPGQKACAAKSAP